MGDETKDKPLDVIGFIFIMAMLTVYVISLGIGVGVALVGGLRWIF
jgi:hypothetical protein